MSVLLTACSSGDFSSGPPPPTTTTLAPEVTHRGVVGAFTPSARIVTLAQPVAGFTTVALTADTQIVRANGATAAATDLVPQATIEVTGRPGAPGTLVAGRIVLR
ncbi:MAG: hypothetical protein M3450_09435 [Actinomycetota bacterium]|nr:hypothetical protein [Actinomycetota bacterium]